MVDGMKCYDCSLINVCKTYSKLKPFTDEAKVDLGVSITFNNCEHYILDEEEPLPEEADEEE